jgi:hypothetical protein
VVHLEVELLVWGLQTVVLHYRLDWCRLDSPRLIVISIVRTIVTSFVLLGLGLEVHLNRRKAQLFMVRALRWLKEEGVAPLARGEVGAVYLFFLHLVSFGDSPLEFRILIIFLIVLRVI